MNFNKHFANIIGRNSNQKTIVFEVDDYGERNICDEQTLAVLKGEGIKPTYFPANDRPGSVDEMSDLFAILTSVKDSNGRNAIFSPQVVTANPDFDKIRASAFQQYFYKDFQQGLVDFEGNQLWNLWKEGIDQQIWSPELHGREHLNTKLWMNALQNDQGHTRKAFDQNVYGIFDKIPENGKLKLTEAFNILPGEELQSKLDILKDSIQIFKQQFGYTPTLFTPPASKYFYEMEKVLVDEGVKCISVSRFHNYPDGKGTYKKAFRYPGKKAPSGVLYSVRNCLFEPHSKNRTNWVDSCLSDISVAFTWNKPAIISSHRINFVHQQHAQNGNGLNQLHELLTQIQRRWPDAQFASSREVYKNW